MRHIAEAVYITMTKTIYNSHSLPANEQLVNSITKLFTIYTSKKNTRISLKFMEELLLNRCSDIVIPIVLQILLTQINTIQYTFIYNNLITLYLSILRKYSGFQNKTQNSIISTFPYALTIFYTQLTNIIPTTTSTTTTTTTTTATPDNKKTKIIINAIKEISEFLKKSSAKKIEFTSIDSVGQSVNQYNDTLMQLLALYTSTTATTTASTPGSSKKDKNSNSSIINTIKSIQENFKAFLAYIAITAVNNNTTSTTTTPTATISSSSDNKKRKSKEESVEIVPVSTKKEKKVKK